MDARGARGELKTRPHLPCPRSTHAQRAPPTDTDRRLRGRARLRAAAEDEPEEIHESIYSNDLLQNQLAAFWQGLRNRFGGEADGPAFADLTGENDTRRTIRAIYQRLLARAAAGGHPRPSAQTPLEYVPALQANWPQPADAVRVITDGYVEARYAADPPDAATAQAVAAAWAEIERKESERPT